MHYHTFSLGHEIATAATRGVVYDVLRSLFRGMPLGEILLIGAGIIGVIWFFTRSRPRRY